MIKKSGGNFHLFLLISLACVFAWSGYAPRDRFTWILEVIPAILGVAILLYTYPRFQFTNLVYILVWIQCVILMVGGKYTYAQMPVFEYFKELFGWTRNNYDKLGHVIQGVTPALIAREVFIRREAVNGNVYLFFLSVAVPLAFAPLYEIFEWLVAAVNGEKAEGFLGTQGYFWDTQTDLFACLIASIAALLLLSRWHNAQLKKIG